MSAIQTHHFCLQLESIFDTSILSRPHYQPIHSPKLHMSTASAMETKEDSARTLAQPEVINIDGKTSGPLTSKLSISDSVPDLPDYVYLDHAGTKAPKGELYMFIRKECAQVLEDMAKLCNPESILQRRLQGYVREVASAERDYFLDRYKKEWSAGLRSAARALEVELNRARELLEQPRNRGLERQEYIDWFDKGIIVVGAKRCNRAERLQKRYRRFAQDLEKNPNEV